MWEGFIVDHYFFSVLDSNSSFHNFAHSFNVCVKLVLMFATVHVCDEMFGNSCCHSSGYCCEEMRSQR